MRRLFYKTISVVLMIVVGVVFMAAHHEKESDDLISLKETFTLSIYSWKSSDVETHFSTIHPEASRIGTGGVLSSIMQDVDYEEARNRAKRMYEGRESRIDDLEFNIQGSVATVTFNETIIDPKFGGIGVRLGIPVRVEAGNLVLRVVRPHPTSPAFEAGIKAGDLLIRIDGVEVNISEENGKTSRDYVNKVKGKIGTSVTLTIQRGEGGNQRIFDVTINRKELASVSRSEQRTAVSQVWTRTDEKWLRLHEHTTHITADLIDLTRRFVEEVWNNGDLSVIDELCAPDVIRTVPPSIGAVTYSAEEMKQGIVSWREAFPDAKISVNKWGIMASSNKVVVRWYFSGTHQGEYMGVAATGKQVRNSGISILTFVKGKIVLDTAMWDDLHTWRQLGVDPPQRNKERSGTHAPGP